MEKKVKKAILIKVVLSKNLRLTIFYFQGKGREVSEKGEGNSGVEFKGKDGGSIVDSHTPRQGRERINQKTMEMSGRSGVERDNET